MKRSTWIVLVVFLALLGVLLYLNIKGPVTSDDLETTPTAMVEYLLPKSAGTPTSIDIESKIGEQVSISRNEAGDWVLKQPIETEADQGSVEAAVTQLTSLRIISRLEVAPADAGLIQPSYTMTVKLTDGMAKTVRIGDLTPTESGYYTSVDDSNEVLIISKTGLDALLMLVTSPPYANTPTPAP